MRVPEEIRKCVVYLGLPRRTPEGSETLAPKGTGFFVQVPSEEHPEERVHIYLVTAKHVARSLMGREFRIRANESEGGSAFVRGTEEINWWTHPTDESVDVAVLGWVPPEPIEYRTVPLEMFLTEEIIRSKSIGVGDEVFMTGLFIHLVGSARNQPIVRMGSIAMMPDEPIPSEAGSVEGYLIESRSIGGLSGSPAFVRETIPMGLGAFHLLGLVHGHWDIPLDQIADSVLPDVNDAVANVNMGIAVVVPAEKIREVLFHPQLVDRRQRDDERWRRETAPRFDDQETKKGDQPQQSDG
jgi:hypothetical protein